MKNKILLYVLFAIIGFFILEAPLKVYFSSKSGWDHAIYCKAVQALDADADPYLTRNLSSKLSYTYPATFLEVYRPLCSMNSKAYLFAHLLGLLGICFILVKRLGWDPYITISWVFLGYNAAFINYNTGNIGIFEALFFVLFLWSFATEAPYSILWLVPSAFIKVAPSLMAIPAVMVEKTWAKRTKYLGIFFAGLAFLYFLNYVYSPELFLSFVKQIVGAHPDQHSPIREIESNASNITILLFLKNFSNMIAGTYWVPVFVFLVLALLSLSVWVWNNTIRYESDRMMRLYWSYLILIPWLPRLKPYSLLIVCIVMIPILQRLGRKTATVLLLISIFHRSFNGDKTNPWLDFLANNTAVYAYIGILIFLASAKPEVELAYESV